MELTEKILDEVLRVTRQVTAGQITLKGATAGLVRAYGLNPNSATMMINSLRHMMKGERYRRALTVGATDHFLNRITEDGGSDALRLALDGLSSHIDYRHSTGVHVPGLVSLLDKHRKHRTN